MKKFVLLLSLLFLFSCADKQDGVKIIENVDAKYLTEAEVDKEPGTDKALEIMLDDLRKVVKDVSQKSSLPAKAYLKFRIYISEEGIVDGIKELELAEKFIDENKNMNIIEPEEFTQGIAEKAKYWEFTPAVKEGKQVKFRSDLEVMLTIDEEGNIKEEIPALRSLGKALSNLSFGGKAEKYFVAVEEQPSPLGGLEAIQKKITYPDNAKQAGIEGRVFVKAYINEKGTVDRVELLKGIDNECDSVAMAAVKSTKFTPAKQRGKPVKVQVSVPIVFALR